MVARHWTGNLKYFQVANSSFTNKWNVKVSLEVLAIGNPEKHHIHILNIDGIIHQIEHNLLFLFSVKKEEQISNFYPCDKSLNITQKQKEKFVITLTLYQIKKFICNTCIILDSAYHYQILIMVYIGVHTH